MKITKEEIDRALKGQVVTIGEPPPEKEVKQEKINIGKGKKYCGNCQTIIAARCLKCPNCEYEFKGEKFKPPEPLSQEELDLRSYCRGLAIRGKIVYIPTGQCPIPLTNFTREGIVEWCETVVDEGYLSRCVYTSSALVYWLRDFVDVNSPEYNLYKDMINSWATGIIEAFK